MPTEAYAHGGLCPMPSRTSYESSKGYINYQLSTVNGQLFLLLLYKELP
jgi:hypothetical protein